mgnify:CR=1 FL=1
MIPGSRALVTRDVPDRHGDGDVVAVAPEHGVGLHVHPHVEIARLAARRQQTPILVFDIETVPDVAGIRRINDVPADLPDTAVMPGGQLLGGIARVSDGAELASRVARDHRHVSATDHARTGNSQVQHGVR